MVNTTEKKTPSAPSRSHLKCDLWEDLDEGVGSSVILTYWSRQIGMLHHGRDAFRRVFPSSYFYRSMAIVDDTSSSGP